MAAFAGDSAWPMSQFPPWSRDPRSGFKRNDGRPNFQRMAQKCGVPLPLQIPPIPTQFAALSASATPIPTYIALLSVVASVVGGDTMQNYLVVGIFPSLPLNFN